MSTTVIPFYIYNVHIEGDDKRLDFFSTFENRKITPTEIKAGKLSEIVSIEIVQKFEIEERYVGFHFKNGDKYPYTKEVIGINLEEKKNPRDASDIEPDDEFFIFIDKKTSRAYISHIKKKGQFIKWAKDNFKKSINLKSIIEKNKFIQSLETISKFSFSVTPNLFNISSGESLYSILTSDEYGFGADSAEVAMTYKKTKLSSRLKDKISGFITDDSKFTNISIIGRNEEGFETTMNMEGITSKITITVEVEPTAKFPESEVVFKELSDKLN